MSDDPSFQSLLRRLKTGASSQAEEIIVNRFASRLAALASRKIGERLRRRVGPEDIVQSVFATFFRRLEDGRLELRDWESVWGLLARIAVWRICRYAHHHKAARRDQDREEILADDLAAFDREPTAEEALMATELGEQFLEGTPEKHRPAVERIIEGLSHEAIAKELGMSLSTVGRVHRRAKEHLKRLLDRTVQDASC